MSVKALVVVPVRLMVSVTFPASSFTEAVAEANCAWVVTPEVKVT